jgi:hypothetical protein
LATPTPVPAPAPKSGGALKIILIVLGVIALVVVLAFGALAYGCYRIAHSISHTANGKSAMSILGSTVTSSNSADFTASDLGTDIYPGATPTEGGSKMDLPTASLITAAYLTSDPASKVEAFYKDKFGTVATDLNIGGTVMIVHKVSDKENVRITVTSNNRQDGKTKIVIQHTKVK